MISQETMNLLIKYFQDYPEFKGIPASSEEIKNAENISFKDSTSDKIYSLKIKSIAQNPDSINLTYPVVFTFSELSENDKFLSGQTGTVTIVV